MSFHLGTFAETEMGDGEEENGELWLKKGHRVSVCGDENFFELDSGDCFPAL